MLLLALVLAMDPALQTIAATAGGAVGGTVGFAALDLTSGRSLGTHENQPFPMQSVFKLPVAIEVLSQVDAGRLKVDREIALGRKDARDGNALTMKVPARRTIGQLVEAMLVSSDNIACDKLLFLVGGPGAVDARMKALGVDGITIRFSERHLAKTNGKVDNTATPAAIVALLAKVASQQAGLSATSAKRLDDLLLAVKTGPKRIKGALPPGTPVAHKTGTSPTEDGKTNATNDVGLVTLPGGNRIAIAVFVHASPADEETRENAIAQLARVAYDTFSAPATAAK